MRRAFVLVAVFAVSCAPANRPPPTSINAAERASAAARLASATAIVDDMESDADHAIPRGISGSATCISVVPALLHAGVLVGFRSGRGVVTCRNASAFESASASASASTLPFTKPVFVRVSGGGAGLFVGAESVDLVMLFMSEGARATLTSTHIELGADTALTAGPVGRQVQASSEPGFAQSIFCYSHARGLYAGAGVTSLAIEPDDEAARAYYGDARDFGVMLRGPAPLPAEAAGFLAAISRVFGHEREGLPHATVPR